MTKLSDFKKEELDLPYTISELEFAIKSGKLNKAPGPDGFSNEFFKYFIDELLVWILGYFESSFNSHKLTPSIIEGMITCIPKGGKSRNDLKNW